MAFFTKTTYVEVWTKSLLIYINTFIIESISETIMQSTRQLADIE